KKIISTGGGAYTATARLFERSGSVTHRGRITDAVSTTGGTTMAAPPYAAAPPGASVIITSTSPDRGWSATLHPVEAAPANERQPHVKPASDGGMMSMILTRTGSGPVFVTFKQTRG